MSAHDPSLSWPAPPQIEEPRPEGRRRAWGKVSYEERYRRQRRDLLRAAASIASRKGYSGTRLADIVAEAGLSKGTFYEHFDSKEDCFIALYRQLNAGMINAAVQAAEETTPRGAFQAILAVCRALTGYVAQDPRLAQTLGAELGASHPVIQAERESNLRRIVELFVVLARRLGSGLDADELELASVVLVHGVVSNLSRLRRSPAGLDGSLQLVARVGCRAFGLAEDHGAQEGRDNSSARTGHDHHADEGQVGATT